MFDFAFSIFGSLDSEQVLGLVLVGLVVLLVLGWQNILSRQTIPGLMTSLGIFGTFWGVFIALYPLSFEPNEMIASIQSLIDGMKTAFLTSLFGMGSAIITKAIWSRGASTSAAKKSWSPEHQDITKHLTDIKNAISAEGDPSLTTEMQKLRVVNLEGFAKLDGLAEAIHNALIENLGNLIQEIRDVVGKQLGESLRQLVDSIQEALIEKFGTTFVQFNEAVQALNKWQQDYRRQVEQLTAAFEQSVQGIQSIRDNCETIPEAMNQAAQIIGTMQVQLGALEQNLAAFEKMRENAEEALPAIGAHLDQIGQDLEKSVASMRTSLQDSITAIGETFATQMNAETDRVVTLWGNNMAAIAEQVAEKIHAVDQNETS